jgi:hypothetical protein
MVCALVTEVTPRSFGTDSLFPSRVNDVILLLSSTKDTLNLPFYLEETPTRTLPSIPSLFKSLDHS